MVVSGFDSLIVGGGRAGMGLHRPCILKAALQDPAIVSGRVGLVECDRSLEFPSRLPVFHRISAAAGFADEVVVHIATGPAERVAVLKEAAQCGYRNFILEKPLATCRAELEELLEVVHEHALNVVVNFPWLSTPLTRRLKEIVVSREHGELRWLTMLQTKSRSARRREAAGHDSAFEIETPHQVSLALFLAGEPAIVLDASCQPLNTENGWVPNMGGASLLIDHGVVQSYLRSDLDCPRRERRISLGFEDGWRCDGSYPSDGEDGSQRLKQFGKNHNFHHQEKLFDDPLTSFCLETYRYFAGKGPRPFSTLELGASTTALIADAKALCDLTAEPVDTFILRGAGK